MHTGPACVNVACVVRYTALVVSDHCKPARLSLAYDDDSLLALSARQNTRKNGVNPVCSARILYKIRCENWNPARPSCRLCTPADPSTVYLHQLPARLAAPQASSTAYTHRRYRQLSMAG